MTLWGAVLRTHPLALLALRPSAGFIRADPGLTLIGPSDVSLSLALA